MEEWQRAHVRRNLVQLIKSTKCSDEFIQKLKSNLVLSQDDVEELSQLTQLKKSKRMYDILQARLGLYEILQNSLKETEQTGALRILQDHESDHCTEGCITFDRKLQLGTGKIGFANKVFRGKFGIAQIEVAVKELNTMFINQQIVVQSVIDLLNLNVHENVVRYHGVESVDSSIYIAIDLGFITLQDEVTMDFIGMDKRTIVNGCANGLEHLHNNVNILHKNLKPSNVLLGNNDQVKLTDYGLPRGLSSFVVVGAVDWMPPEISRYLVKNEGNVAEIETLYSKKTDIFSLGCIYYFTVTNGLHPFGEIFSRQHNIVKYNPSIDSSNVNSEWINMIKMMIAENPEDRWLVETILPASQVLPNYVHDTSPEVAEMPYTSHQNLMSTPTPRLSKRTYPEVVVPKAKNKNQRMTRANTSSGGRSRPECIVVDLDLECAEEEEQILDQDSGNFPGFSVKKMPRMSKSVGESSRQETVEPRPSTSGNETLEPLTEEERNLLDGEGNNLIHQAIIAGKTVPQIQHLIKQGIDWQAKNNSESNALHEAAAAGHVDALKYLLTLKGAKANLKEKDGNGMTPLLCASYGKTNFIKTVEILIENGANKNAVDKEGDNLLFLAALNGKSKSDLQALSKLGVKWRNVTNNCREGVIHVAAKGGNLDALKYFISLGGDVNDKDCCGKTPLHFSAFFSNKRFIETINFLRHKGANIKAVDDEGSNVIFDAAFHGRPVVELEQLDRLGIPWKKENRSGQSVLHFSVMGGNVEAVKYFLGLGLDPNDEDNLGETALLKVALSEKNIAELLTVLKERDADFEARNNGNDSLLSLAESKKMSEVNLDIIRRFGNDFDIDW